MPPTTKNLLFTIICLFAAAGVHAATVSVDLSDVTGTVSDEFYGVQVGQFGAVGSKIDVNGDGYPETSSDYTAHRNALNSAKITYLRRDMSLQGSANSDGTFKSYNIDPVKSQVKWAYENNKKILLEANFMPTWLADNAANCASDRTRCAPKDYTRWGKLVVDYLDYVTENGRYASAVEVEVWNEPYQPRFLAPDGTAQDRINIYNKLYPATRNAIKAKYPNMPVGGPPGWYATAEAKAFTDQFLTKFPPSQVDFVSLHHYSDAGLSSDIQKAIANVKAKGHGKDIKFTEYNVYSSTYHLNKQAEYKVYLSETLVDILNNNPDEVSSMVMFHWSAESKYSGSTEYPEYPMRWILFSEAKLDNTKMTPYYVSQDFGTYHPGGSSILSTKSAIPGVKVLTTKTGSKYYMTVVNRNAVPTPVTVTVSGKSVASIKPVTGGSIINLVSSILNLGVVPAFSVKTYEITLASSTPPPPPPATNNAAYIRMQAETGSLKAPMVAVNDASATGDKHIVVPTGSSIGGAPGKATFTFNVPTAGTYKVIGKVIAPDDTSDSFTVSMDYGSAATWDVLRSTSWRWDDVNNRDNGGRTMTYALSAGQHTLIITGREDGTKLDSITITNDLAYPGG